MGGGLKAACEHLARRVLTESGAGSKDVVETLGERFLEVAERHQDFVRQNRDSDKVIEDAVMYLADVHAIPPMGTDLGWFEHSMAVLIELAVPNSEVSKAGGMLFPWIQEGIRESIADMPISRSEMRLEDADAEALERLKAAGCADELVGEVMNLVERMFHGDSLSEEDKQLMKLVALAAPVVRVVGPG